MCSGARVACEVAVATGIALRTPPHPRCLGETVWKTAWHLEAKFLAGYAKAHFLDGWAGVTGP